MRTISREIASALIYSKDGKILMGLKDPAKGGVYSDSWHLPGGGQEPGETLEATLCREVLEETGIDITKAKIKLIDNEDSDDVPKNLKETGERVISHMHFSRFRVELDLPADQVKLSPSDDLINLRWFSRAEIPTVKHPEIGVKFFKRLGLL